MIHVNTKKKIYEPGLRNTYETFLASPSCTFITLFSLRPPSVKLFILLTAFLCTIFTCTLKAQQANVVIKKGNDAYKKGDYTNAINNYNKAIEQDRKNTVALFNLGNALQKANKAEESLKQYDAAAETTADADIKSKACYNKGLSLLQQKKLVEAIDAFKESLRLKPNDEEARENLQKALNELKQKKSPQKPQNNRQKQQPKKPEEKKTKMSRQMMEQKFAELRNQEKRLQKQLQEKNNTVGQQEKDW